MQQSGTGTMKGMVTGARPLYHERNAMKLPNGYGSVYRLHGNRRKPWAVRVTVSRDPWKYRYLGYYESQEEALTALALYNKDPFDLDARSITFAEVYEKWSAEHYQKISASAIRAYRAAYIPCAPLYGMPFADIRLAHLQGTIDQCGKNHPTMEKMKLLMSQLYTFAMRNDLCTKDYSEYVDIQQYKDRNPDGTDRKPFTADEIRSLWSRSDQDASIILMLIYTGVRISELLDLKKEDVNLEGQYFNVTAAKTAAGVRKVPIADRILPFFREWMDRSPCEYLLCSATGKHMIYRTYLIRHWTEADHKPHDTRHTCISMLADAGVDERIIKRIVGHKGTGVTETVYTHLDFQLLLDAVNLLK